MTPKDVAPSLCPLISTPFLLKFKPHIRYRRCSLNVTTKCKQLNSDLTFHPATNVSSNEQTRVDGKPARELQASFVPRDAHGHDAKTSVIVYVKHNKLPPPRMSTFGIIPSRPFYSPLPWFPAPPPHLLTTKLSKKEERKETSNGEGKSCLSHVLHTKQDHAGVSIINYIPNARH